MIGIKFYPKEYKALTKLGLPIVIAQIGFTLQGLADTLMVGQHSAPELAAAGFVNSFMMLAILLSMGFGQGAVSQIGALYAQGKKQDVVSVLKSSVCADFLQGLLITFLVVGAYFVLPYTGQDPELLPLMQRYYLILLPSLPILATSTAFKTFCDAINYTRTSMWILLVGNVWNVLFNWLFIYGRPELGIPEMGIDGAAWATSSSRVLMLALFVIVFFRAKHLKPYSQLWRATRLRKSIMIRLNKLGWPIATQMIIENAAWCGMALMLGVGGTSWDALTALSAHQVMVQVSSLIYMFYLGIGAAVAVRVSNYNGLNDIHGVRQAANAGYQMSLCIGIISSTLAFIFRYDVSELFISADDPHTLARVNEIVAMMAYPLIAYQIGDGLQTIYVNALRGYGDVKVLMKYSVLAYLCISIPLSLLFCFPMDGGAPGIWWGFPFGLTTAAILYLRRFRKITTI